MKEKKRIFTLDAVKAFGIFCVVVAHNDYTQLGSYLYSFHMPIFFFISGLLFNPNRFESFNSLVISRVKSLLIPYFSIASILFIFWFFLGRKFGQSAEMDLSAMKNFIGIFYAQGAQDYMDWGIPLWFLPALFLTTLVYFPISKLKKTLIIPILIVFGIIGYFLPQFLEYHLPWSVDIVFTTILFYGAGHLFKGIYYEKIERSNFPKFKFSLLFLSLILNIVFFILNDKLDISKAIYHNYLYMLLSGLGGSIFYIILFSFFPYSKFISYLGKNSLLIMGFHLRAMTLIKLVVIFIFQLSFQTTTALSIVYAVVQIVILLPLIWFINKYLPFVSGKSRIAKNT